MREKTIFLVLALLFLIPCAAGAESEPSQLLELLQDSLIAPYEEALPLIQRDCATAENDCIRLTVREALYDGIALHTLIEVAPVREGEWIVIEDRALASPRPHRAAVICEYPYLMVYQRPAYPNWHPRGRAIPSGVTSAHVVKISISPSTIRVPSRFPPIGGSG